MSNLDLTFVHEFNGYSYSVTQNEKNVCLNQGLQIIKNDCSQG